MDPLKHNHHSFRLNGYDYTQPGAYFVTLCTWQRECLFGEVVNGEMHLNEAGRIVQEEWLQTEAIRPNVHLGAFVVMPNHIHGIIIIEDLVVGATRRVAPTRPTRPKSNLQAGSLGAILGQFKSMVTKKINAMQGSIGVPVWQRNYYEHIIRDEEEWRKIHDYIVNNPARWEQDQENPHNL